MNVVITGSPFSGKRLLAQGLSQTLGYRHIDDQVIVEKAAAFGGAQGHMRDLLRKPPAAFGAYRGQIRPTVDLLRAALLDELASSKVVYQGDLGILLLEEEGTFLRVRVEAPREFRAVLVRERLRYAHEESRSYLRELDQPRDGWVQYLYGRNWTDPSLYDVVVNLATLRVDDACALLSPMLDRRNRAGTSYLRRDALRDMALASRVRAALSNERSTNSLNLTIRARGGAVEISGRVKRHLKLERVTAIATRVPEVNELDVSGLQLSDRGTLLEGIRAAKKNVSTFLLPKGVRLQPASVAAGVMFVALLAPFTNGGNTVSVGPAKIATNTSCNSVNPGLTPSRENHCDSQPSHHEDSC